MAHLTLPVLQWRLNLIIHLYVDISNHKTLYFLRTCFYHSCAVFLLLQLRFCTVFSFITNLFFSVLVPVFLLLLFLFLVSSHSTFSIVRNFSEYLYFFRYCYNFSFRCPCVVSLAVELPYFFEGWTFMARERDC